MSLKTLRGLPWEAVKCMKKGNDPILGLQSRLTDRDWTLLGWLYDHDVLTTEQIAHALFPSLRVTQKRLLALLELQLVDRFRYLRPGGGSNPWSYVAGHRGMQLIALHRGRTPMRPALTATRRQRIATSRNLAHTMGINQFFTDLAAHARLHPPARLLSWLPGSDLNTRDIDATRMIAVPDGYGLWEQNGVRVPFFLEYDRGTEGLTVLAEKLTSYRDTFDLGVPPYPVLFWLPSARREQHLTEHIAATGTAVLVATTAADRITTGHSPADQIWAVTGHPGLHRLADLYPLFEQLRSSGDFAPRFAVRRPKLR